MTILQHFLNLLGWLLVIYGIALLLAIVGVGAVIYAVLRGLGWAMGFFRHA